jgi:hypothetical protein
MSYWPTRLQVTKSNTSSTEPRSRRSLGNDSQILSEALALNAISKKQRKSQDAENKHKYLMCQERRD